MKSTLFLVLIFLTACGGASVPKRARLSFVEDVLITDSNGQKVALKRGDSVELADNPIEISSEGKKSLMVLPLAANGQIAKIKLSNLSVDDLNENLKAAYNKNLEQLLVGIVNVQKEMAKKNNQQAKAELDKMKKLFPDLALIKFMEANIFLIEGNRDQAKMLLEQGLLQFPDNSDAIKLYRQLLAPGEKDMTRYPSSENKVEEKP